VAGTSVIGPVIGPVIGAFIVALGGAAVSIVATTAAAQPSETVEVLRHEADQAAQAYFDALAQAESLEGQVAAIEAELPELQARRRELRADARHRAALAYVRAGQTGGLFDAYSAADAARRSQWIGELNARDHAAFDELASATADLDARRRALQQARDSQQTAIDQLEAQNREISTKLQAAEDLQRKLAATAAPPRPVVPKGSGGAPPVAPPDYTGTPGPHPQHDQPFLVCTRARESGGNYAAHNPAGPYMGAYQFHQGTWNSAANHAGRPELIGVPPHTASQYDQDDNFIFLYHCLS